MASLFFLVAEIKQKFATREGHSGILNFVSAGYVGETVLTVNTHALLLSNS